ncbi:putative inactive dipeptidyl peptidase 10-like [Homarus americanus]|uniref:Putative inactive dipeptidyl peptidase 10-like n=1 Tax=Homarus americanus TaxID=6706 RepID=A0A8J5JSW6_HOMAM|nr:putative inactive dipeptidyl peptidase 10-like [Homarus americanus]
MYLMWMSEHYPDEETVSKSFYHTVFTRDYNIVFRAPLTDVCNTCEKLESQIFSLQKDGQDISDVRNTLREHKAIAQVPRDLLHQAEQGGPGNGDVKMVAIDLQQTLPCPRLRASNAYYKQKLWVYNYCVYDMDKREGSMFVWDQEAGGQTRSLKWPKVRKDDHGEALTQLQVFCDNCGSQNKTVS